MVLRKPLALTIAVVFGLQATVAWAQLEGKFTLARTTYTAGEPVFLQFEVRNTGSAPVSIKSTDPYSFCAGYTIEIADGQQRPKGPSSCAHGFTGSCLAGVRILKPGDADQERYLLNSAGDLSHPGHYRVSAARSMPWSLDTARFPAPGTPSETFSQIFEITIEDAADPAVQAAALQPFYAALRGNSPRRYEAARVIGTLAPPSAEDELIAMLKDRNGTAQWGLTGLGKLNTPKARDAVAAFLRFGPVSDSSGIMAVETLSRMGDKGQLPFLEHLLDTAPTLRSWLLRAIAQIGGDDALPFLLKFLASGDLRTRQEAFGVLGETGSRAALTLLVGALGDPDGIIRSLAASQLVQLTHLSPSNREDAAAWKRWLTANGRTATLYTARECGSVQEIR